MRILVHSPDTARRASLERAAGPVALAMGATAVGLLLTGYKYLDHVASGGRTPLLVPLIEELSAAYGAATLLYLLFLPYTRRIRGLAANTAFTVATHAGGALAFSAAHTTLNWLLRSIAFPLVGLGSYSYGSMPARYAMELPMDVIVYTLFVLATHAVWRFRESRQAEVNAAWLESQLLEAQLRSLRGQLEPHFLFNAMNAISSVMYENPATADEMLGHLGDLLRASLANSNAQVVTVREELDLLQHYLALLRVRFADRLVVDLRIQPKALERRMPSMLLQPLVENAVRHGGVEQRGHGRVAIAASVEDGFLRLEVTDDGPGVDESTDVFASGLGLSATRERLRLLYGHDDQIHVANLPGGGFRVTLMLEESPAHVQRPWH